MTRMRPSSSARRLRLPAVAVLAALVMTLSACGSSGTGGATSATGSTKESAGTSLADVK